MSDAPSQTDSGDAGKDPRPAGQRLTDASQFVTQHLAATPAPKAGPETQADAKAAAHANENGADILAASEDVAELVEEAAAAAPVAESATAPSPMPYMLPPSQDGSDGALPPMFGDYGPTDGDPTPLRFLREPVQYVGAEEQLANGAALPPAVAQETSSTEPGTAPEAAFPAEERVADTPPAAEQLPAEPSRSDASSILSAIDAAERSTRERGASPEGLSLRLNIRVPHIPPDEQIGEPPSEGPAQAEAIEPQADAEKPQAIAEVPGAPGQETPHSDDVTAMELMAPPPLAAEPLPLPGPSDDPHDTIVAEADAIAGASVNLPEDAMREEVTAPPVEPPRIAPPPPPGPELAPELQAAHDPDGPPHHPPVDEIAEPADPLRAAAARIAAEASATAQALESLKRLLENNPLPDPQIVAPPRQIQRPPVIEPMRPRERAILPPTPVGQPVRAATAGLPPYIAPPPATPPLPMPIFEPQPSGGGRIYLLGFLAGFGLALAAGAMLYLFISVG